jgi:hypothetical protein
MRKKGSIQMIVLQFEKLQHQFDAVMTVSGMRYPCEIREVIVSLLLIKYKSLYHPSSWFVILKGFLDCFHNSTQTKSLCHKIFGFENGRSGLLFGEEWPRFPQERRWAAENYSRIRSKDSQT